MPGGDLALYLIGLFVVLSVLFRRPRSTVYWSRDGSNDTRVRCGGDSATYPMESPAASEPIYKSRPGLEIENKFKELGRETGRLMEAMDRMERNLIALQLKLKPKTIRASKLVPFHGGGKVRLNKYGDLIDE